jgi:hypothetical protein
MVSFPCSGLWGFLLSGGNLLQGVVEQSKAFISTKGSFGAVFLF